MWKEIYNFRPNRFTSRQLGLGGHLRLSLANFHLVENVNHVGFETQGRYVRGT